MRYHAEIEYSTLRNHYWYNYSKEKMLNEILIPFINGQVALITSQKQKKLLNLKSVTRLTIYQTKSALKITKDNPIIKQLKSPDFSNYECTEEFIQEAKLDLTNQQTYSLLQKSLIDPLNQVFVIMRFGDNNLDSAYRGVIKPLFEEYGIAVVRVDEIPDAGRISDQMLDLIASSKYIYSDLSGSRPNCYYETGFAHALGKTLILSIKKPEVIHFDLAGYRFIQWETEHELRQELRKRIEVLIENN